MITDQDYIGTEIQHIFRKDLLAYELDDIDDYVYDINYLNSECITDNWSYDTYTYIVENDVRNILDDAMDEFKDLFHDEYGYYLEKYNNYKLSDFDSSYTDDEEDCNITIRVADHISNTYNFKKFNQDENYIFDIVFDTRDNINKLQQNFYHSMNQSTSMNNNKYDYYHFDEYDNVDDLLKWIKDKIENI